MHRKVPVTVTPLKGKWLIEVPGRVKLRASQHSGIKWTGGVKKVPPVVEGWNDNWGRRTKTPSLNVDWTTWKAAHKKNKSAVYKYSLEVVVGGITVVIDPEVCLDEILGKPAR